MNDDNLISQVYKKIEREKTLINGASALRQQTDNPTVQQRADSQIREGRKNIKYLEDRMRELQMRRMGQGMEGMSMGSGSNGGPPPPAHGSSSPQQRGLRNSPRDGPPAPPPKDARGGYGDRGDYGDPGPGGYSQLGGGHGMMPPRAPFGPPAPSSTTPKARPNYSKLGMLAGRTGCSSIASTDTALHRSHQIRYTLLRTADPAHVITT